MSPKFPISWPRRISVHVSELSRLHLRQIVEKHSSESFLFGVRTYYIIHRFGTWGRWRNMRERWPDIRRQMTNRKALRSAMFGLAVTVLALCLCFQTGNAQVLYGSIVGTVTDSTGASESSLRNI